MAWIAAGCKTPDAGGNSLQGATDVAAASGSQVFVGISVFDKITVCTLTIQKGKDGKTIGMKLDGLAKGKIKATEQMAPSSVEVGEAYRDGSGGGARAQPSISISSHQSNILDSCG
jgi:hypothetical protein